MVKGMFKWLTAALHRADASPGVRLAPRLGLAVIAALLLLAADAGLLGLDAQDALRRHCESWSRPQAPL